MYEISPVDNDPKKNMDRCFKNEEWYLKNGYVNMIASSKDKDEKLSQ